MKNLYFYIFCIIMVIFNSIISYGAWKDKLEMKKLNSYTMITSCEVNGFFTVNSNRLYMCVYMGKDYIIK